MGSHPKLGGIPKVGEWVLGGLGSTLVPYIKEVLSKYLVNGIEVGFFLVVKGCTRLTAHQKTVERGRKLTFIGYLLYTRYWAGRFM